MLDQAAELRKLARQAVASQAEAAPMCIVTCGAGRGAGATSTAVTLARVLARHGNTVVLDAGPLAGTTTLLGCATTDGTVEDVLTSRQSLSEVLQPAGRQLRVAPSAGKLYTWQHSPAVERLWRQLCHVDAQFAVLDGGCHWHAGLRQFYQFGAELLMVATSDAEHVLNAYAMIKTLTHQVDEAAADAAETSHKRPSGRVSLLVNRADPATAEDMRERLGTACERFLARQIELLYSPGSTGNGSNRILEGPAPTWATVIEVWAEHLASQADSLAERRATRPPLDENLR